MKNLNDETKTITLLLKKYDQIIKSEEILTLIEEKTDTLNEQTKTNAQETIEIKLNKPKETFYLDNQLKLEKQKCFLWVTNLEVQHT